MEQPAWLAEAWRELGQRECADAQHNTRILAFYRDAGHSEVAADEVAWCAAFAGACLERAKVASTRSLMARSYLSWGEAIERGRLGAIAVFSRGRHASEGHVGFWVGETEDAVMLLGGNQGDAVSVAPMAKSRLLGIRWPSETSADVTPPSSASERADMFSRALQHVLEMEGGYTDDPHDAGGPTNFGIILAEFAAWNGERLDASNTARLKEALKRIDLDTVREIYRANYWTAASCKELPPALALMHFDAAVNHGVATAMRFLQQAVGAGVDGEMGPETRAAIARAPLARALEIYAELRRTRYRSLKTFWRFGRGWLRRVDVTLARASELLDARAASQSQQQNGELDMADTPSTTDVKWWGHSLTIWGTIVSALATIAPAVGAVVGVDITGDLVQEAGNQVVTAVQAVMALAGTLMTIYGRVRATQPLARREVNLKL